MLFLNSEYAMKELIVILLSTAKFGMTFPLAIIAYKFSITEAIIWTNIGGLLGIYAFAYLSKQIILIWRKFLGERFRKLFRIQKKEKKKFSRQNRRIVRIKANYGLAGIALATPILFSIPVGVFLAVRYYHRNRLKLMYIFGGNLIWSFIYSFFYFYAWEIIRF